MRFLRKTFSFLEFNPKNFNLVRLYTISCISKVHANQLKLRSSNELIDAFDLINLTDTEEVEPTIIVDSRTPRSEHQQRTVGL